METNEISESYPEVHEKDIHEAEKILNISIPDEYRGFLLKFNGGRPKKKFFPIEGDSADNHGILDYFLGIHRDYGNIVNFAQLFRGRIPLELLPIARDPGGNIICISISGINRGEIYFWDHEEEVEEGEIPNYDNIYFVANSFSELLESLQVLPD